MEQRTAAYSCRGIWFGRTTIHACGATRSRLVIQVIGDLRRSLSPAMDALLLKLECSSDDDLPTANLEGSAARFRLCVRRLKRSAGGEEKFWQLHVYAVEAALSLFEDPSEPPAMHGHPIVEVLCLSDLEEEYAVRTIRACPNLRRVPERWWNVETWAEVLGEYRSFGDVQVEILRSLLLNAKKEE
ncbi:hypothetical protein R1flu_003031 [Riccia fluitans]|uniref:Uncharacterized protein n=1 Tax=Riccia fluitans TaxID=41844 RepID=A0ABD1Y7X3_9MARC